MIADSNKSLKAGTSKRILERIDRTAGVRMLRRRQFGLGAASLALASGLARSSGAQAKKTLRVVPYSEPTVFDPHQSPVSTTSVHALMIYDQLFGWDASMAPQPQMVETWEKSKDGLLYSFTLRPGLKFHDGRPVTTRDVIPSLQRMFARDDQNQIFASLVEKLDRTDDHTFTLKLKESFGYVEYLLGGSNGSMGSIMREQDALTDPHTPVRARIGSGPFKFVEAEYRSGDMLVYEKNTDYVPRAEPASGFAGGKVVKLDRVEWHIIPDPATAFAALRRGEVDFLDAPSLDLVSTVANDPNIVVGEIWPIESYAELRFNSIQPPFDNVKARQAVAHAVSQADYMSAAYGDPKVWHECYAFWVCGTPNGTEVGSDAYRKPDLELARKLVVESGYKNHKVVLIGASDIPAFQRASLVTADLLKKIGFDVDVQLTDWGSVAARRVKMGPPSEGGWNLFHTSANGAPVASPLTSPSTIMTCDGKNFPGWPCDPVIEGMRMEYVHESDPAKQQALLEAMHRRLWDVLPYVPLGQFKQPFLWRKNVTGVLRSNNVVYWNIDKT
jgi:peptide/nickel transport system substrate-binding protein